MNSAPKNPAQSAHPPNPFLVQRLKLWPASTLKAPANELQFISAWLSTMGDCGQDEALKRMEGRLKALPADPFDYGLEQAQDKPVDGEPPLTPNEHTDRAKAQLKVWFQEGLPVPRTERECTAQWLYRRQKMTSMELLICFQQRMTLLLRTATALHAQGKDAEEAAGIFEHRPEMRVR